MELEAEGPGAMTVRVVRDRHCVRRGCTPMSRTSGSRGRGATWSTAFPVMSLFRSSNVDPQAVGERVAP